MTSIKPFVSLIPGDLPPLVNNIRDWDAVIRLQREMTAPGLSLAQKVARAANPGLEMPAGTAKPNPASTPAEQQTALIRFNAVVDALVSLSLRSGFDLTTKPKDIQVFDLFYMGVPQPGFNVQLVVKNRLEQIPVYQRV